MQPALSNSTYPKSPSNSKVNPFLYVTLDMTLGNGILLDHYSHCMARFATMTTRTREDDQGARGTEDAKTVAWKRRRKRARRDWAVLPPLQAVLWLQQYYRPQCRQKPSSAPMCGTAGGTTARDSGTTARAKSTQALARTSGTTAAAGTSREYFLVSLSHLPPLGLDYK